MAEIEKIEGRLHYESDSAYLIESGKNAGQRMSLLAMDNPPLGSYGPEDAAAAYGYFLHINLPEDTNLKILGFRFKIVTKEIILIVRFA